MSDSAGDSADAAVQQLFAHLRNRPQPSFTMASPTPSRNATNPVQAPSGSENVSSFVPQIVSPSSQSASLLNLLKFNTGANTQNSSAQSPTPSRTGLPILSGSTNQQHVRGVSTSDLVGSSMGHPAAHENANTPSPPTDSGAANLAGLSTNPQDHLLQLLTCQGGANSAARSPAPASNQPSSQAPLATSPALPSNPAVDTAVATAASPANRDSPIRVFGSRESREPTPFEVQALPASAKPAGDAKGIFTYSNPFEQLAAFSPRNKTPAESVNGAGARPASPKPTHRHIAESIEVASPAPLADGRTRVEALMGIGAPTDNASIVSKAVGNVAEQLDKREPRLDELEELSGHTSKKVKKERSPDAEVAAPYGREIQVKQEDQAEETVRKALENLTTDERDAAIEEMIDAPADDEKSSSNEDDLPEVPVYNMPIKPFVAIQLHQSALPSLTFREKSETIVARLKKEFDQIDRNLVTASSDFIVYAPAKKPFGIRVINQDEGWDRQLFKENDPIFNVSLSSSPAGKTPEAEYETFIATGQSGAVYWAVISNAGRDTTQDKDIEQHCLIFPPSPAQDDNTSGGQLKTRAKKSNRHPEFFAIGRGKTIQVIFPFHALQSKFVKKSVVDTDAYFRDRSLKINTGKAGKDFTFSEDDTVLASLDKAGRLRFWDVRDIVDENNGTASKLAGVEVNTPIMTLSTAHVTDKAWPTSVLFVDKVRPYVRGSALRYVIVGMKQNHTLQLWDLGLGKVVQELNLPHDNESDAICSVAYHPSTGIVVVGHPTRNSIYFIHLSAPRYNLQGLSQAKYLQAVVTKHQSLPKPDSTAILSGLREYSFGSRGQIRSLDLLPSQGMLSDKKVESDKGQFELYVMHSKGVSCLSIKKADLGWSADNKVLKKLDGEKEGVVVVKALQELRPLGDSEVDQGKSHSSRPRSPLPDMVGSRETESLAVPEPALNGTPSISSKSSEKRKKKKAAEATSEEFLDVPPEAPVPPTTAQNHPRAPAPVVATPRKEPKTPKKEQKEKNFDAMTAKGAEAPSDSAVSLSVSGDFIEREYKRIESGLRSAFETALGGELEKLRKRMDDDRRAAEAGGAAKMDAILRLVSTSLTENVEKTLERIVSANITKNVVPAVNKSAEKSLQKSIPEWLKQTLPDTLTAQFKQSLPEAIANAISGPQVLQAITEGVSGKLSKRIDKEVQQTAIPQLRDAAVEAATKVSAATERNVSEQITRSNLKAREDSSKIDKLTLLNEELLHAVRAMAENTAVMRTEIAALQEEVQQIRSQAPAGEITAFEQTQEAPTDPELEAIVALMNEGRFEDGTIQWLQSPKQASLFDNFFVKYDPTYLQQLPSLVTLSVGAAVVQSLEDHVVQRLQWLDCVLSFVDPHDSEIKAVAPQIMDVVVSRLESRYMSLAEADPTDSRLRQIPPLTKAAKEIKLLAQSAA